MAAEGGRCGPLCQHPGCWYSSEKDRIKSLKCQGYLHYLAGLLLKREPFRKEPDDDGNGLPTLKVQTLEDATLPPNHHTQRRRTQTLPPVRTFQRPCSKDSELPSPQGVRKPFSFVQMTLEEEEKEEAEGARGQQEVIFSPVLIWKPGRKLMKNYHRRVDTPPQVGGGGVGGGRDGGGGVGGRRSPIPLKTMDLTDALPPERTDKAVERKETPKHRKGHRRPTTADAESFAYLGDIPPQVVAEILQQLRSESSSNIDGVLTRPVTTTNSIRQPSASKPATITNNASNNDTTNIPSSIVYNLSSKKLQRTSKPVTHAPSRSSNTATNRKRVTSFSRELSKRPLEVLRGRYSTKLRTMEEGEGLLKGTKQGAMEEEGLLKGTKQRTVEEGEGLLLLQKQNLSSYRELPLSKPTKATRTALLATQIEPSLPQKPSLPGYLATRIPLSQSEVSPRTMANHSSTRYPYGNPVVPRVPQKTSLNDEEVRRGAHTVDHMGIEKQVELLALHSSPHVLPKVVTFQGGRRGGIEDHTQAKTVLRTDKAKQSQSPRPRRAHIVQVPRHRLPSSAHSYSQRPFSEEASSVTPETRAPEESPATQQPALEEPPRNREENTVEHCPVSASVSPDYMLVGAHFSGEQVVLLDREGQVIHQLTDTVSNANLTFYDTGVVISGSTLSNNPPDPLAHEISNPADGIRAPPPTDGAIAPPSTGSIAAREQDGDGDWTKAPPLTDGTTAPPPTGSIAAREQDGEGNWTRAPPPTDGTIAPPPTGSIAAREKDGDGDWTKVPPPTDGTIAPPPTGSIATRSLDRGTVKQVQPVEIPAPLTEEREEEGEIGGNDADVDAAQHGNTDDETRHTPINDTISTTPDSVNRITDKTTETVCSKEPDAAHKSSEDLTPQTEPVKSASQVGEAVAESTVT